MRESASQYFLEGSNVSVWWRWLFLGLFWVVFLGLAFALALALALALSLAFT